MQAGLSQAGCSVDWVKDGIAADLALKTGEYAAVVLDLGLPRLTGLELLRRLRAAGNKVPVLILTARDTVEDRIKGLDCGADDYLIKPFDLHELAARLRALVRRSRGEAAPKLCVGEVGLDPAARCATWRPSAASGRSPRAILSQTSKPSAGSANNNGSTRFFAMLAAISSRASTRSPICTR